MSSDQEAYWREWNKTAECGHICKACGRVFLLQNVRRYETDWVEQNGERSLIAVRNQCPHCNQVSSYGPNELGLYQCDDDGKQNVP